MYSPSGQTAHIIDNPINEKLICVFIFKFFQIIKAQIVITPIEKWVFANCISTVHNETLDFFSRFIIEMHTKAHPQIAYGAAKANTIIIISRYFFFFNIITS